jgi:alpha-mannosidase
MLKHPKITSGRIKQFIDYELKEKIVKARTPLSVEFCPEHHSNANDAKKSSRWQDVEQGFRYGPAYTTFWFRVSGKVPSSFAGQEVALVAETGGERTVWKANSPWCGIDEPHGYCTLFTEAKGGEKVCLYIESYTRNPQCRVHRRELPREELVETVGSVELVTIDRDIVDLLYDCDFAYETMNALDAGDPLAEVLMRALDDVCNQYSPTRTETIGKCRRIVREAFTAGDSSLRHSVTPVGHAHLDTAWLWPIAITKKKMAHTTATQLGLIERYPEYVFAHSQASQYEWLETEYPALFQRVKEAIGTGQWEPVGSMWVEADCNLTGPESLVRQFLYGRRYFRDKLGYETKDMWLPDVFGYSAAIPQILSKFSIQYFLTQKISWNQINKFPNNTFWWQGIDGTKIWTHFPPSDTYTGDASPAQILNGVRNHKDHARSDQSIYLFGFGDGGGGPTERQIEFMRRAKVASGFPEILSGRRSLDFFADAKARSKDLATWVGELYAEFHRGTYTSQAANKKQNRLTEFLMRDAELLACFTDGFPAKYPAAELERAWKLVLLNQFHDIIPGSSVNEVYRDSTIDYAKVREIGERVVDESLQNIGAKFDTSGMSRPVALFQNSAVPGMAILPWKDSAVPTSLTVGDENLPVQEVKSLEHGRALVFPTPQAALGAVCVGNLSDATPTVKYRVKGSSRRLENNELSVKFDANGHITSIQLLDDGTELIQAGKLANVFQILDDKPLYWSAWDIDVFAFETAKNLLRCESMELVERGPVRSAIQIVRRYNQSTITQRISLGPVPGIFFETEVDWHEEDKLLKVAFPLNVNSPRATYEIQFGNVERPTHYNTSWDIARFEVCAQKWADLSESDQGVAILNNGKYGHDIHGNVMRLSLLKSPKAPDPEADMGVHHFTYVVLPHYGPYNYASVVQNAYALNAPVRYAFLNQSNGESGTLPQFVSCDDRNIVIEAVKKAEMDGSIVVRLYECHNARGRTEFYCIRTPKSVWLCDLEEKPIRELEVHEGGILFDYKPFEILTFKLEF